jgi:hypothetical protein
MSQLLAVGLLLIIVLLMVTHFKDIKNSGNKNG